MNEQDADAPVPEATPAPEAAEAPKRKRAPRKKPAVVADAATAAEAASEVATPAPAASGTASPVPPAPAAVAAEAPGPVGAAAEPPADAPSFEAAASPADAQPEAGSDAGAEGSPGRSRNRRRGRRGGEKRDPAEVLAAATPAAGELFAEVLAGSFDAQAEAAEAGSPESPESPDTPAAAAEAAPSRAAGEEADDADQARGAGPAEAAPRRVLAPEADAPKLHKVLAQSGAGSRRDLEQMIGAGRVTVNGEVAHTGQRISYGDRIAIDGKPVRVRIAPPPPRVLAYHKPAGEVVSHDDPQQRPTVFRRLPRLQQGKWQSVGRLDINTEGLLLFTNSGELANQLMHPRFGIEREYAVRSLGTLSPESKARLLQGVEIDGQACAFKSIEDGGGEGVNHWYRCVITEGRNREVRKLFDAVGHAVSRLIRIRYGSVVLPRGLKRGVWVDLDERDLRNLRSLAGAAARQQPPAGQGAAATGQAPQRGLAGPGQPQGAGPGAARDTARDGKPARKRRGRGRKGEGLPLDGAPSQVQAQDDDFDDMPPGFIPDPLQTSLPGLGVKKARPPRPARVERPDRGDRSERGEGGAIPNPLQQTYDKRAIQQERALRRDMPEDGPIPNPLQQTYDKRALMRDRAPQRDIPEDGPIPNPLQQTYDKRFASGGGGAAGAGKGGGGARGKRGPGPARKGAGPGQGGVRAGGPGVGKGGPKGQGKAAGKAGAGRAGAKGGGGARQPDPLQTAVGYIGGDAFLRKGAAGKPRSGGGGGPGAGGGRGGKPRGGPGGQGGPGRGGRPR